MERRVEFKVEYIKDLYNSYMVLIPKETENEAVDTYSRKMLTKNDISGLLPCEIRCVDMEERYYYDISSKQPVVNVFEKGQVDELQTEKLVEKIIEAVKEARKYMLFENSFVLSPQYIYMNISNFEVSLCYLPGYNKDIREQLSDFLEFLLEKVDHNNQKAIVMSYGLYKLIKGREVSFENIEEFMKNAFEAESEKNFFGFKSEKEIGVVTGEAEKGEEEYEEWNYIEEDNRELLSDDKIENKGNNIPDNKIEITAGIIYGLVLLGIYFLKLCHRDGKLNIGLFVCVAVTGLCICIGLVQILRQRLAGGNESLKPINGENGYDDIEARDEENDYLMVEEDEELPEDEKTVLLSQVQKKKKFALKSSSGEYVSITAFPFIIGKYKEKVDYYIDDVTVSRLHAKLEEYDEDILMVTDLNSTNGTFVSGRQLKANEIVKIGINETLSIGEYEFTLIRQ